MNQQGQRDKSAAAAGVVGAAEDEEDLRAPFNIALLLEHMSRTSINRGRKDFSAVNGREDSCFSSISNCRFPIVFA
jgi:hypothetical protein